jgi:hypothetical protein
MTIKKIIAIAEANNLIISIKFCGFCHIRFLGYQSIVLA